MRRPCSRLANVKALSSQAHTSQDEGFWYDHSSLELAAGNLVGTFRGARPWASTADSSKRWGSRRRDRADYHDYRREPASHRPSGVNDTVWDHDRGASMRHGSGQDHHHGREPVPDLQLRAAPVHLRARLHAAARYQDDENQCR